MNDIHDIVPPFEILPFWLEYLPHIIVLTILVVVFACLLGIQKYKEYLKEKERQERKKLTPYEVAINQLIKAQKIKNSEDDKKLALSLSNTIRYYMENEFDMHAPEKTTEEFLYLLQHEKTGLFLPTIKPIQKFTQLCDLAKYAKQELTGQQRELIYDLAYNFIETTHDFKPKLAEPEEKEEEAIAS